MRLERLLLVAYVIVLAVIAADAFHDGRPYLGLWTTISYVAPCTVLGGCLLVIARASPSQMGVVRREQLWLLLCMTAMCSLVQVPYATWGYILYFAPIPILALLAIVMTRPAGPGMRCAVAAGFFLMYGLAVVNPNQAAMVNQYWTPEARAGVPLAIPRTGVKATVRGAARYERTVALLRAHSKPGEFIYAAPDVPELYFLSERRNPTRTLFDFIDDSAGHDARVLRALTRCTSRPLRSTRDADSRG